VCRRRLRVGSLSDSFFTNGLNFAANTLMIEKLMLDISEFFRVWDKFLALRADTTHNSQEIVDTHVMSVCIHIKEI
jgi:hypothetical protein